MFSSPALEVDVKTEMESEGGVAETTAGVDYDYEEVEVEGMNPPSGPVGTKPCTIPLTRVRRATAGGPKVLHTKMNRLEARLGVLESYVKALRRRVRDMESSKDKDVDIRREILHVLNTENFSITTSLKREKRRASARVQRAQPAKAVNNGKAQVRKSKPAVGAPDNEYYSDSESSIGEDQWGSRPPCRKSPDYVETRRKPAASIRRQPTSISNLKSREDEENISESDQDNVDVVLNTSDEEYVLPSERKAKAKASRQTTKGQIPEGTPDTKEQQGRKRTSNQQASLISDGDFAVLVDDSYDHDQNYGSSEEDAKVNPTPRNQIGKRPRKDYTNEIKPFKCGYCPKVCRRNWEGGAALPQEPIISNAQHYLEVIAQTGKKLKPTKKCKQCKSRESRYHCPECPEAPAMVQHERVHTKEKPYSCSLCGIAFTAKQSVNRHMRRAHAGAKKELISGTE